MNRYPNKEQEVLNNEVNIYFENRISLILINEALAKLILVHYSRSPVGGHTSKKR
jgi:hypothetical protein